MIQSSSEKTPKRALGRGLSALIPQAIASEAAISGEALQRGVFQLPIEQVERDGAQPRKLFDQTKLQELAASIKAQGIIQPVLVRKSEGRYRIIAGERRWRAAQLAGLQSIPALVREATEAQAFEMALVENLQRTDLNPIEEAEGYRRLIEEFSLTQEQVSERVGKERSSVTNTLRLLGLPDEVKGMVADGVLSMGHARALLGLPTPPEMLELAQRTSAERLSVREVERRVQKSRRSPLPKAPQSAANPSPQARAIVEELQRALGTKVHLHDRGGRGVLELEYYSYEDLDRLRDLLRK